jgi:hypothetical protein
MRQIFTSECRFVKFKLPFVGLWYLLLVMTFMGCQKASLIPSQSIGVSSFNRYSELNEMEKAWADSLILYGLDHEALFSLTDSLKPISSLRTLRFPFAKDSLQQDGDEYILSNTMALDTIAFMQNILNHLHTDQLRFCLIPFKYSYNSQRSLQILVVNLDAYRMLLHERQHFFGQWGFTAETPPEVLLTAIEYESKLDRFRAYGYLFGYPAHAVDFFVEAAREEALTGEFVKRSFFPVPTYSGKEGYFTYALPQNFTPTAQDSLISLRAEKVLAHYQMIRAQFQTENGVKAHALLEWVWKKKSNVFSIYIKG